MDSTTQAHTPRGAEKVTIFKHFASILRDEQLHTVLHNIRIGTWAKEIKAIRQSIKAGNKEAADQAKSRLLAFTPAGTYVKRRISEHLSEYIRIVVLDFDKIPEERVRPLRNSCALLPYTLAAFISPSGRGIKVLVRVDSGARLHKSAFLQVAKTYGQYLGIQADPSGKDITRLCFVSHDPEMVSRPNAAIFNVKNTTVFEGIGAPSVSPLVSAPVSPPPFVAPLSEVEAKADEQSALRPGDEQSALRGYEEGNRNNFLFRYTCQANREGIAMETVWAWAAEHCADLPEQERKSIIEGVYQRYEAQHDSAAAPGEGFKQDLLNSPTFPDGLFADLPAIMRDACARIFMQGDGYERERDIMLLFSMVTLSSMLPGVSGQYQGKKQFPNLFTFVAAPPANGKGVGNHARWIAAPLHDWFLEGYEREMVAYDAAVARLPKGKSAKPAELPQKPERRLHIVPANNTSANIYHLLHVSEGHALILDTEADTLSGTVSTEKGSDISQLMRKAAEFEWLDKAIKTESTYARIQFPRISMALCGTPKQLSRLVKNAEDGLFSRILFYVFRQPARWRDSFGFSSSMDTRSHAEFFTDLGHMAFQIYQRSVAAPIRFTFTDSQWSAFNAYFRTQLSEAAGYYGAAAEGIIKRLGTMFFRIAMCCTALEHYQKQAPSKAPEGGGQLTQSSPSGGVGGGLEGLVYCPDHLFQCALQIISVCQAHAFLALQLLPKADMVALNAQLGADSKNLRKFLNALPMGRAFKVPEILPMAKSDFGLSRSAVYRHISRFQESGLLRKDGAGLWVVQQPDI